jgi:hypothetical protein
MPDSTNRETVQFLRLGCLIQVWTLGSEGYEWEGAVPTLVMFDRPYECGVGNDAASYAAAQFLFRR